MRMPKSLCMKKICQIHLINIKLIILINYKIILIIKRLINIKFNQLI